MRAIFSEDFDRTLVDLAWSLWTELGVRGVVRRHETWTTDPEALVVLTSAVAATDPRLRDESLDWCTQFQHHLSRGRLRTMERELGVAGWDEYERFVATIARFGTRKWPASADPFPFEPSSKSEEPDLRRPSLLRLRLRAIFGVSARAELMHALIAEPMTRKSVAQFSSVAGYTKRNLVDELEGLEAAGVLDGSMAGNRRLYRLHAQQAVREFVGPVPEHFPDWTAFVHVLVVVARTAHSLESLSPRVRDIEASKQIEQIRELVDDIDDLEPLPPVEDGWAGLTTWSLRFAEALASASTYDRIVSA